MHDLSDSDDDDDTCAIPKNGQAFVNDIAKVKYFNFHHVNN